jgi:putative heme iron utilization protein
MTNLSVKDNSETSSTFNAMANSKTLSPASTLAAIPDDVIVDRQVFNDTYDAVSEAVRSAGKAKLLIDELSDHPLSWEEVDHGYLNEPHDSEKFQTALMVLYDFGRRMTLVDILFDYIFEVRGQLEEIRGMLKEKSASTVEAAKTETANIKPAI